MRYLFVFLAIAAVWVAVVLIAAALSGSQLTNLYFAAQALTLMLFYIGFYSK